MYRIPMPRFQMAQNLVYRYLCWSFRHSPFKLHSDNMSVYASLLIESYVADHMLSHSGYPLGERVRIVADRSRDAW